jgi:hypothetical protein
MQKVDNEYITCVIGKKINDKIKISGFVKNPMNYSKMAITAPNPIDVITSFSGKGLPFPCELIAFENTPNFEIINSGGKFDVEFLYPNSYYSPDGYTKIISPIIISLDGKKIIIQLKDCCPLKTLNDRSRGDPKFYGMREIILPIGTAEETMNNYAYAKYTYNIA